MRETILDNGRELNLLDLFELDLDEPRPDEVQPENHVYSRTPWRAAGRLEAAKAAELLEEISEPGPELFGSTGASVKPSDLGSNLHSLAVVEPKSLSWELTTDFHSRPRVRARFELSGQPYDLVVTDPAFFNSFSGQPLGVYQRESGGIKVEDRLWFTISLTEPFEDTGECYKLVAAVICVGD
jgi:hypothetical protein